MKIEIQEMTQTKGRIIFTETDASVINAIRRTMMADVPKMAIENVEFHMGAIMDEGGKEFESISPLFDEIVAHKIGLLPVPTDLETFVPNEKCTCKGEGCLSCTIMYSINKKGPCTVYSGDLEPLGDGKFKIKDDLIPIIKLADNQAILAYANAQLSTGRPRAVVKNLEAFLSLDLPGSTWVVGDGPARRGLERRFPRARFFGMKHGAELAWYFAQADAFVFPSRTDTFGLVMLEAMACGTTGRRLPGDRTAHVVNPGVSGVLHADLATAALAALDLSRERVREHALASSWEGATSQFVEHLHPSDA